MLQVAAGSGTDTRPVSGLQLTFNQMQNYHSALLAAPDKFVFLRLVRCDSSVHNLQLFNPQDSFILSSLLLWLWIFTPKVLAAFWWLC